MANLAPHTRFLTVPTRTPAGQGQWRRTSAASGQDEHRSDRHYRHRRRLLNDVDEVAGGREPFIAKENREDRKYRQETYVDDVLACPRRRQGDLLKAEALPALGRASAAYPPVISARRGSTVAARGAGTRASPRRRCLS